MRTFIAVDLDPGVKTSLGEFVPRLKRLGRPHISWVKDGGMHITLKFLGEIDDAQAASVKAALTSAAAAVAPFPLVVRGTGRFPENSRTPRILWVGTSLEPALHELQKQLESRLVALGFQAETRAFHPHLTLGRVRSGEGLGEVLSELERCRDLEFGAMTVETLTLFKSTLKPSGAEYEILGEGRLA